MMRKTKADDILEILDKLQQMYPDAKPGLSFSGSFELLIATILSAQCTDKQVNKTTEVLFAKFSSPHQLAALTPDELEPYIKACGLYRAKAKNIIETCKILMRDFSGEVPKTREELMTLPGVGRKVANVVLSNAFGVDAIAVDTHVFRVANRIGLSDAKNVLETEKQLMDNIPKERWSIAHHLIIFHGRQICSARNPACGECLIKEQCKWSEKNAIR